MANDFKQQLGNLRHLIGHHYDQGDVVRLCAIMNIDFEHLFGKTKLQKVNSLLNQCAQKGQLAKLVGEIGRDKPQIAWPPIPMPKQGTPKSLNPENGKGELKSALQRYLDDVKQKLLDADLRSKSAGDEAVHRANALVRESFSRLDPPRRREMIEFLHKEAFIERGNPLLNMADIDLSHSDLSWITLSHSQIRFINLTGADLSLAKLSEVDLSGATLRGVRLKAYLVGAELIKSDLREADLSGAHLANATLAGANLRFATFEGADLKGANLTGADLRYANFQDADLSGVNFSFTTLSEVNLRGAVMKGAIFQHTKFRDSLSS